MLDSSQARCRIDQTTEETFVATLIDFAAGLSPQETLILSALMHEAMDPWSRSLISPPDLTAAEAAILEKSVPPPAEES